MKVLHCITGLDIGGAERQLMDVAVRLKGRGMRMHVAYLKGDGTLAHAFREEGVTVHHVRSLFGLPGWIIGLFGLMRAEAIDVVHTHLIHATIAGRIAARMAGIRCIFTTEHNTSNWNGRHPLSAALYARTAAWTNRIYAISEAVARRLTDVGSIPSAKIWVLYDGVDLKRFDPNRSDIAPEGSDRPAGPRIVCIGRLDPRKGQDVLMRAMSSVLCEIPKARAIFVGSGKEEKSLRNLAAVSRVEHAVEFAGTTKDVRPFLLSADVVVQPSREEGLSISVIEALAMGRPVIATNVGGIPEIVSHEDNGILVPDNDSDRLAESLIKVLRDPGYRNGLMSRARRSVAKRFSLESIIETLTKDYERCHRHSDRSAGAV